MTKFEIRNNEIPVLNLLTLVSHELRTPLTAILGYADILQADEVTNTSELKEYLGVIQRNALSQCQVIDDLMDATSILLHHLDLDRKAVNIVPLALDVIETLRPESEKRNIAVAFRTTATAAVVMGDEARLSQIFHSLISNAIKFSHGSGMVHLSLEVRDRFIHVSVRDDGIGIAKSSLNRIFDLFVQADSSLTRKYGGLGLGLSITRYLVEAHGGNITAESAGLGCGATFKFKIPLGAETIAP
jgi:signal transduction histidine kinase